MKLLTPFAQDDEALLDDLAGALRIRNRLAHHFFRERAEDFASFAGRERVSTELLSAEDLSHQVDARLGPITDRYFARRGLDGDTRRQLEREILTGYANAPGAPTLSRLHNRPATANHAMHIRCNPRN